MPIISSSSILEGVSLAYSCSKSRIFSSSISYPKCLFSAFRKSLSYNCNPNFRFKPSPYLHPPPHLNRYPSGNYLFHKMERYWNSSGVSKNNGMVKNLEYYGIIKSKRVTETMETIDRALFVPEGSSPYADFPIAIGFNATISAPHMHAMCLQLLEPHLKPGSRALDVGSGTGYLTACFAVMVGKNGRTTGVEHIPELVDSSLKNIEKSAAASLLNEGALSIHVGDGREGWKEDAPYDAIHVGAAAPEIPAALIEQLKPGGKMVIPVGNVFQDLLVVSKDENGVVSVETETSVRYVPLTSRDAQLVSSV